MKIAVLVKQVPGSESVLPILGDTTWIDEAQATFVMNPPDNFAIEEALLIKEKIGEGEVVIISMGPSRVQKVIREGLAKGADRGIHLEEDGTIETDPLSNAKSFTSVLKEENFDLVLSGLQSDDTGMGQTGVLIGEMLGMSTATLAMEVEIQSPTIRVKRELESGWFQWVKLKMPSAISIQSGLNTPRYPSLKGIMGAKRKEIKVVPASDHQTHSKSQSIDKVFVPQTSKQTVVIEGDADSVVSKIVNILKSDIKVI
ncbi:MAG: electron transfer flavoprotein subunit beta/FixA family protein [Candidatus Marinimicrobia bacterium]|jgi:electron transfer flavoprotein beta subunit|nr:electron transfer flavoprotein subunit beta/FixA family protein [Candidatus Neomarinimicrobiota bacterium]MBT3502225.1 electron transfer flavoprotein subunit beta/FixA family protein [Candidatus Neomarinimicrobiota bacterium]MBT3838973.1 electron transfer flavoprotein subunit beta/FixA family protein [Candidatus Neomarinimicrobiota bacterium]MBT3999704.1 electron transfer flavoprotein subunit beta/FixA family protein [Candidatus Neomarinimicrobiota bacterium]MBT4282473.1 electron transfer fl